LDYPDEMYDNISIYLLALGLPRGQSLRYGRRNIAVAVELDMDKVQEQYDLVGVRDMGVPDMK
jgi:hypothetical protein